MATYRNTRLVLYATDVRGYVYAIRTMNERRPYYIGSTREPERRWAQHKHYKRLGYKGSPFMWLHSIRHHEGGLYI